MSESGRSPRTGRFGIRRRSTDAGSIPSRDELSRAPGIAVGYKLDPWWWLVVAVAGLIVILILAKADPFLDVLVFVADGIVVTIILTICSFFFILFVGLLGGLGRIASNGTVRFVSSLYVEVFRGIPLLVQLIWWYFAAPVVIQGIGVALNITPLAQYRANAIVLAIVGLVVCYGAYMTEIFRAGIQSIPRGQMEAARSLGMNYFQAMRHVILPQAMRVVLPPVGNEFIMLLKDTSLVSVVAVADLTRRGREFMSVHFNPIEVWTLIALVYLLMTLFSARVIARLEKRKGLRTT